MSALPAELRLEVKTTRRSHFTLDERDLAGVLPEGHLVALITPRRLGGPRWVVVPGSRLSPGSTTPDELVAKASEVSLTQGLQGIWSDWLLDEGARARLVQGGGSGLRERVRWCRAEHPPRPHRSRGGVREVRLHDALARLRELLDAQLERGDASASGGAQAEGQLHQVLIEDALRELGYDILPNPVGVPDVSARLGERAGVGAAGQAGTRRAARRRALEAWQPSSERLRQLQRELLALDDEELDEFDALDA